MKYGEVFRDYLANWPVRYKGQSYSIFKLNDKQTVFLFDPIRKSGLFEVPLEELERV